MRTTQLFRAFFHSEKSSGIILIGCTLASLLLTNFLIGPSYADFWHTKLGFDWGPIHLKLSVEHWINDGLMTIFFLMIGLEIEREIYEGEMSNLRSAILPVAAAIGGMLVPALIHFGLNRGTLTQSGFGIPMATDIAFSLGVLSLVGKRVPMGLKVFLTALAIIDDLGAILVIALFYSTDLQLGYLFAAIGIFGLLMILNRLRVMRLAPYLIGGVFMWYCMLQSGVHATISGVMLAFAIPFGDGGKQMPSNKLEAFLHFPVAFIIVPLFALANTCILLGASVADVLGNLNSMGIIGGLIIGKPAGILFFSYLVIKLRMTKLPENVNWLQLIGVGVLAGIGFTMSIFITLLAFNDPEIIQYSKLAILFASLLAGIAGYIMLRNAGRSILLPLEEIPWAEGEEEKQNGI